MERGKLIVIEGTDASGKATQARKVVERLREEGISCEGMSFPAYDLPTGKFVSMYLGRDGFGQEFGPSDSIPPRIASTFYAMNRYELKPRIVSTMTQAGVNIITDRYVESNMGHQGGKIADASERERFFDWIENLEHKILGLPRPDGVVFLNMPHQVGLELKRGSGEVRDGHETDVGHLQRAEDCYHQLAEKYGWRKIDCAPEGTFASLRTPEDIGNEVYEVVRGMLGNV